MASDIAYYNTLPSDMKTIYHDCMNTTLSLPMNFATGDYLRKCLVILQRNPNYKARNGKYHNKELLCKAINHLLLSKPLARVDTKNYMSRDATYFQTFKGNLDMQNMYIDLNQCDSISDDNSLEKLELYYAIMNRDTNYNEYKKFGMTKSSLVTSINKLMLTNPLEYMDYID